MRILGLYGYVDGPHGVAQEGGVFAGVLAREPNQELVWLVFVFVGLLSALVSFVLVGVVTRYARTTGLLSQPGGRQSHTVSTPTGGGLGMVASMCLISFSLFRHAGIPLEWAGLVVPGAMILTVTGWLDDRRPISPLPRLLIQLAVSFVLLILLRVSGPAWAWLVIAAGGIVMVWIMNMYNFMDGSHGMAGAQGVFSGIVTGVLLLQGSNGELALAAFVLAGCCLGFLPWNFPRPKVFMGDAGSVPLGFALGSLLLLGVTRGGISLPLAAMVLGVFLVDATLTLCKRVFRRERWYTAHNQHVYQRLIAHGWPHSRVLLLYQAINLIVVVPAMALAKMYPGHAWSVAGSMALLLSAAWYAASLRLEVRT